MTPKTEKQTKEKEKIDTSILKPNEHFSYLGKKYVKKHVFPKKFDSEGNPVLRRVWHLDGSSQVVGQEVVSKPVEEFWGIIEVKTDLPAIIKKWGKPLTTQIKLYGPVDPDDLFKYEDEPIKYDNDKLKDKTLVRKKNKIVEQANKE